MTINDSPLFQNFIAGIAFCLLTILFIFLITKKIIDRIKEGRKPKYRLAHNIKQKKKKKISLGTLIFIDVACGTGLMFLILMSNRYWMDYHIKDYQKVKGEVQSIKYKSNFRSNGWIVRIQGRDKPFILSEEEGNLIKQGEIHTIIYAKRTGMILKVQ